MPLTAEDNALFDNQQLTPEEDALFLSPSTLTQEEDDLFKRGSGFTGSWEAPDMSKAFVGGKVKPLPPEVEKIVRQELIDREKLKAIAGGQLRKEDLTPEDRGRLFPPSPLDVASYQSAKLFKGVLPFLPEPIEPEGLPDYQRFAGQVLGFYGMGKALKVLPGTGGLLAKRPLIKHLADTGMKLGTYETSKEIADSVKELYQSGVTEEAIKREAKDVAGTFAKSAATGVALGATSRLINRSLEFVAGGFPEGVRSAAGNYIFGAGLQSYNEKQLKLLSTEGLAFALAGALEGNPLEDARKFTKRAIAIRDDINLPLTKRTQIAIKDILNSDTFKQNIQTLASQQDSKTRENSMAFLRELNIIANDPVYASEVIKEGQAGGKTPPKFGKQFQNYEEELAYLKSNPGYMKSSVDLTHDKEIELKGKGYERKDYIADFLGISTLVNKFSEIKDSGFFRMKAAGKELPPEEKPFPSPRLPDYFSRPVDVSIKRLGIKEPAEPVMKAKEQAEIEFILAESIVDKMRHTFTKLQPFSIKRQSLANEKFRKALEDKELSIDNPPKDWSQDEQYLFKTARFLTDYYYDRANQIRDALGLEKKGYLKGYMRHLFAPYDIRELPESEKKQIYSEVGKISDPTAFKRYNVEGYKANPWEALRSVVYIGSHYTNLRLPVEFYEEWQKQNSDKLPKELKSWMDDYLNITIKGAPTKIEKSISPSLKPLTWAYERITKQPVANPARKFLGEIPSRLLNFNRIWGNVPLNVLNSFQKTNVLGFVPFKDFVDAIPRDNAINEKYMQTESYKLRERYQPENLSFEEGLSKFEKLGYMPQSYIDKGNAEFAFRAGYKAMIRAGGTEEASIKYGEHTALSTQFLGYVTRMPMGYNTLGGKTLFKFMGYSMNTAHRFLPEMRSIALKGETLDGVKVPKEFRGSALNYLMASSALLLTVNYGDDLADYIQSKFGDEKTAGIAETVKDVVNRPYFMQATIPYSVIPTRVESIPVSVLKSLANIGIVSLDYSFQAGITPNKYRKAMRNKLDRDFENVMSFVSPTTKVSIPNWDSVLLPNTAFSRNLEKSYSAGDPLSFFFGHKPKNEIKIRKRSNQFSFEPKEFKPRGL